MTGRRVLTPDQPLDEIPEPLRSRLTESFGSARAQDTLAELVAAFPEHARQLEAAASRWGHEQALASLPSQLDVALDEPELSVGRHDSGRYRILERIGSGGLGVVYRAYDRDLQREVALKFLRDEQLGRPGQAARFVAEARLSARVQHPGVLPVYDVGSVEGRPFLAMELVDGETLRARLDRFGPRCDADQRAELMHVLRAVAEALAFAHSRGVVHRDLKPSNVLLGVFGAVRVIDWGLAVEVDRLPERLAGGLADSGGTPAYLAPELPTVDTSRIGPVIDVFAWGGLLAEVLTGRLPFGSASSLSSGSERRREELAGTRDALREEVADGDLRDLAVACLAEDPAERPADAGALVERLTAYLDSAERRAEEARVQVATERQRRRATRRLVGVAGMALLVAIVLLQQVRSSERRARHALDKFRLLADGASLREAERRATKLLPAGPDKVDGLRVWFRDYGEPLSRRLPELRGALRDSSLGSPQLAATPAEQLFLREALTELVADLEKFVTPRTGLLDRQRSQLEWSERVEELSILRHQKAWAAAAEAVLTRPAYAARRFELRPQLGLAPLGENPRTGLQEFLHLRSAAEPELLPERGADGWFSADAGLGIVFVLVPGGPAVRIGSQGDQPSAPHYEPDRLPTDEVYRELDLPAYFVAAHELTQAQWMRLGDGSNPSQFRAGEQGSVADELFGVVNPDRHPVDLVNWSECRAMLGRHGLRLPSGVEWEFAARGLATTSYYCGPDIADLEGHANVLDQRAVTAGIAWGQAVAFDDGHAHHAPVASYAANPFGLFDIHGNIFEWCEDEVQGDLRTVRGGAYHYGPVSARCSHREIGAAEIRTTVAGCRAVRSLR